MTGPEKNGNKVDPQQEGRTGWLVALLASSLLHGGLVIDLERGELAERIKGILSGTVHIMDQAGDFLQPANLKLVVQEIQRSPESKEKIEDLIAFYSLVEQAKNDFTLEELTVVQENMQFEINEARRLQAEGADKSKVIDYLLSREGEYEESQNSFIRMMSEADVKKRKGNCNARALRMTALLSVLYPDDYANGHIQMQTFEGQDTDGDGDFDTPPHVRTVIAKSDGSGEVLVAEGRDAYPQNYEKDARKPTTMEVSELMRHSFLAANGLYEHKEGSLKGKRIETQFDPVFVYPDSPAAYASGLVVPAPALKLRTSESATRPSPIKPALQPERQEAFAVKLLDDLPPEKTLTIDELNKPGFDLSQYNDVDASVVQYLWDHYKDYEDHHILWELSRLSQDPNRFKNLNSLSDPAMARAAVMLGTDWGEVPEMPWKELKVRTPCRIHYTGKIETVAAAEELTRYGNLEGGYVLKLTQEPSSAVAQVLGRVNLVYLQVNFFPSKEILAILAPKEDVVVNISVQTASQIEPLVEWLSQETWPPRYLDFKGTVPDDLMEALKQRFPKKFR